MLQTADVLKSNSLHGRLVAVFWLSNVKKMTIKTLKNVADT